MKKILITIFIIAFVGVLGLTAYFLLNPSASQTGDGTTSTGISFKEFFPFGQKKDEPLPNPIDNGFGNNPDNPTITDPSTQQKPKIRKIYQGPVAGITAVEKARIEDLESNVATLFPAVRSVNRITGHIIDIFPDTEEQVVVSSRTIPQIHEALFGPSGSSVAFRYLSSDLETTSSFVASFVPGASADNALKGSFLPENLLTLSVDKQSGKLFYLQNFDGSSSGSTADADGGNKKSIFSHSFSEWSTDFLSPTKILFTTKPTGLTAGYSYTLNTQSNIFEKLVGGITGLTVLPNKTGDKFLLGEGNTSGMKISLLDSKKEITSTQINTIPEKCTWSTDDNSVYCGVPLNPPTATYPDVWYQGQVSFSDTLERYNLSDRTKESIGSTGEAIDIMNPTISKDEKYLYFINKRDGSVWVADLKL